MYAPSRTLRTHLHPSSLKSSYQATSKQASKQALLLSVLAIARPHCSRLYSALAILEPRWWCPCQIQVLSQKLTSGTPGRRRQVGRCPPKTAYFVPQNSLFWPETALKLSQNGQKKANGSYTPRAPQLPREQQPFLAQKLHNMSETRPKTGQ